MSSAIGITGKFIHRTEKSRTTYLNSNPNPNANPINVYHIHKK